MTFMGIRDSALWSLLVTLVGNLLVVTATSDFLESPYLVEEPGENSDGGLEAYKDFLFRYFHPYPQEQQLLAPHYAEDGIEDEELSFPSPPLKRLGSEFLGKRSISNAEEASSLEKRRIGSEFLGKRRMGSEFPGKRNEPLAGSKEENEKDFSRATLKGHLGEEDARRIRPGSEYTGKKDFDGSSSHWDASQELNPYFLEEKRRIGSEFLGKRAMGSEFLGKRAMGSEFLGKRAMGSEFLGKRAMGSEFLGKRAMGSEFLGKRAMGSEFLGKRRIGSEFLGKRAMGSEFLGKRAMGSEFLGKRRMGSEFLGKRAMGSEFLGKRRMGSEFLGKRRMGSEFLGKRRMGSEFLGKRSGLAEGEESDLRNNSTFSDRETEI